MAGVRLYGVWLIVRGYRSFAEHPDFTEPRLYEALLCAHYGPGDGESVGSGG